MIYSPAFNSMPVNAKNADYVRIKELMDARFSAADREAVMEILCQIKKHLSANF